MLKRIIGAAVLVALAVIFLPMLVKGPAPDSGAADVPLSMPAAPDTGMETRELPLAGPADAPAGGAVGMPVEDGGAQAPDAATPASQSYPAATAGGNHAVHFGSYASAAAAQSVVNALAKVQLPAYSEATQLNGKPAWRVRIGPFANQADAEAARQGANRVRSDVPARVVVLDAESAAAPAPAPVAASTAPVADVADTMSKPLPAPAASKPVPTTPVSQAQVATKPEPPKPQPAKPAPPPAPKPVVATTPAPKPAANNVGFVVQLAAYANAADATALRDRARGAGFSAFTESVKTDKGTLTRVRVGPVADRAAADQLQAQVRAKLGVSGIVRPNP